nr:PTS sugar transporter subunit IIB [uncultured Schaedlerella sp.]
MRNIILVCAAGMSTGMLVKKMREAAASENYEAEINAYPIAEVGAMGKEADIILLGPQVRYNLNNVKAQFPDKPVEAIDPALYGMLDGKGVIAKVKKKLGD